MSWMRVREWLSLLREMKPPEGIGLSPAGAEAAKAAALDAWSEDVIVALEAMEGEPFESATLVAVRTVFTAPLEWAALLLGRGTRVRLKMPRAAPGWGPDLCAAAAGVGLPLELHFDREAVFGSELVIAMGNDDTIRSIGASLPSTVKYLGYGHRFSLAWMTSEENGSALAEDLALYDGRGCFSPAVVLTPMPLKQACESLAEALARMEERWPRGRLTPIEGAQIRARTALAQVVGYVCHGSQYVVQGVPAAYCRPLSLPRAPLVVSVRDKNEARRLLKPFIPWISTIASEAGEHAAREWQLEGVRYCRLGAMQRPPVFRLHDGRDWIRETFRQACG